MFRAYGNQANGKTLEAVFEQQAKRLGMLAVRNGQKVRWLSGGRMVTEKSQLDFTLLGPNRQVAFVDCKSTQGRTMAYSAFDARQLALALEYGRRGFVAGFCVCFRATQDVAFLSGEALVAIGPRKSASPDDANRLGTLLNFDLNRLFSGSC